MAPASPAALRWPQAHAHRAPARGGARTASLCCAARRCSRCCPAAADTASASAQLDLHHSRALAISYTQRSQPLSPARCAAVRHLTHKGVLTDTHLQSAVVGLTAAHAPTRCQVDAAPSRTRVYTASGTLRSMSAFCVARGAAPLENCHSGCRRRSKTWPSFVALSTAATGYTCEGCVEEGSSYAGSRGLVSRNDCVAPVLPVANCGQRSKPNQPLAGWALELTRSDLTGSVALGEAGWRTVGPGTLGQAPGTGTSFADGTCRAETFLRPTPAEMSAGVGRSGTRVGSANHLAVLRSWWRGSR